MSRIKRLALLFLLVIFSLGILLGVKEKNNPGYTYVGLGKIFFKFEAYDIAESFYIRSVDILKRNDLSSTDVANDLKDLAWQRLVENKLRNSVALIKKAILVCEKNTEEMASLYEELGSYQHYSENYEESEIALSESIRIYTLINHEYKHEEVFLLTVMHCVERGMWKEAEYKLAEHECKIPECEHKESRLSVSGRMNMMGKMAQHKAKDMTRALGYYMEACKSARDNRELVYAKLSLGSYYKQNGQTEKALQEYNEALALSLGSDMVKTKNFISREIIGMFAIPLGEDLLPTDPLMVELERYRTIILGEIHGTMQSPHFVSQLVRKLVATQQEVILALEIPQSQQETIDKFIRSGDEQNLRDSSFFSSPPKDQYGWASRAVVDLLSTVRKFPNVRIVCFDPDNYLSANDRDEKMANKLIESMPQNDQSKMIVLVGSLHAQKSPIDAFGQMFTPMTHHLLNMENCNSHKLLTIMLSWEKAEVWGKVSFSKEEQAVFGKHILPAGDPSYVKSTHYNSYFLFENFEGYDATLFIRNIDASPPAFDSNTAK